MVILKGIKTIPILEDYLYLSYMNWSKLYHDLLNGDPIAILAISAVIYTIVSAIQTYFIAALFRSQNRRNTEIREINRLKKEKHIERIKPIFYVSIYPSKNDISKETAVISLKNASASNIVMIVGHPQKIYGRDKWIENKDKFTLGDFPVCSDAIEPIDVMIYSHDEDGRMYHQDLWICKPKSYIEVNKSLFAYSPKLVTSIGIGALPEPTCFIEFDKID